MTEPQAEMSAENPSPRKRGRKLSRHSDQDLHRLFLAVQTRGEAIPGDLAQELGWARSTLAYNLGRLQGLSKIARMGGGRSIRYRVATPEEQTALFDARVPKTVNPPAVSPVEHPIAPSPGSLPAARSGEGELKEEGFLKSIFKKLLKG
jgi:hypothetical protein